MTWPDFTLKNLSRVLAFPHGTEESAVGFGGGNAGANPPQPPALGDARITEWARAAGRCIDQSAFAEKLAGRQVEDELSAIFRETPEFGRSLAMRLADFHELESDGPLSLIGGGGEAVVFGDPENQRVIKLLSSAGKAGFGWKIDRDADRRWMLRPGRLAESLFRFWLAERHFPTGLELEFIGGNGDFLVLSQPFFLGENPDNGALSEWMAAEGWERFSPPSQLVMLQTQTWRKDSAIATDVRPENAILASSDGRTYPFDFILHDGDFS
ncbi:hypothetical protein OVA24_03765 [Luteolibacter sp. SL250]|uniref:hypothetical protein n=1 Tax=Luteolibacter sp. SL250 TaxID=2995170 RepID=UPI00226E07E3|nr:hypothetical protein [Luteolibacter sp. SL250]WAC20494.1 hypothetical protein OVA24_03765 [Luteolibacter sp. SL250]